MAEPNGVSGNRSRGQQFWTYLNRYPLPEPRIVHKLYTLIAWNVSFTEEPDVGNPQVRFREGH